MATVINAPVKAQGTVTYPKLRVILDSLQFTLDSIVTGTLTPSRLVITDSLGVITTSTFLSYTESPFYSLALGVDSPGVGVSFEISNASSTAGSNAFLSIAAANGDAYTHFFDQNTLVAWAIGNDVSDSNAFKLSNSLAVGTADVFSVANSTRVITFNTTIQLASGFSFTPASSTTLQGQFSSGALATPSITFGSDQDTGFYQASGGSNTINIACGATASGTIGAATWDIFGRLNLGSNSAGTGGSLYVYSTTANKGGMRLLPIANADNYLATIRNASTSADREYTIPDPGADASFVMTAGSQAITGAKTFDSSALKLQEAGSTDVITIAVASLGAGRTYTMPDAGGAASFVMTEGSQTINGAKTFGTSPLGLTTANVGTATTLYAQNTDNSNAASGATITAETGGSSAGDPWIRFYNNVANWSIGMDNSASDVLVITNASTLNGTGNIVTIFSTGVIPGAAAGSAGVISLGDGGNYWNDVSYKTLTDRGCIPWCDDGVEMTDGTRLSDLDALCAIQKHPTRRTPTGLPRLDYSTFPAHSYRAIEEEVKTSERFQGATVERDANGEAWIIQKDGERIAAQDGVEMTMLFGVFIGAFKQLKQEIDSLKAEIAVLKA